MYSLRSHTLLLVALCVGATLALAPRASAQPTPQAHTLSIHDGEIHVNGRKVPPTAWPESLNVDGVTAQYRFVGVQMPVIELDGRLFAIDSTLTRMSEAQVRNANASVVLQARPQGGLRTVGASRANAMRSSGESQNMQEAHRAYLREMQQHSRDLYERLVHERRMEAETLELARVIRLLPEGPERQAQIDTLRSTLNEIFELKQENRRREIKQLERQMQDIQNGLEKREDMRDEMIEQRIQQLLNARDE